LVSTVSTAFARLAAWAKGETEMVTPTAQDRRIRLWFDTIDYDQIARGIRAWGALGNPRGIAEAFDEMRKSAVVAGVTRQAKAGVADIETDVSPSQVEGLDETRLERNTARTRRAWEALKPSLCAAIMECRWEGGGVIELEWEGYGADGGEVDDEGGVVTELLPVCAEKIPLQRIRRDINTGDLTIAPASYAWTGAPLTDWPDGSYIVVDVDRGIMAFDRRGTYAGVLTDWWRVSNVLGWWAQDIEMLETPTAVLRYGNAPDEAVMKDAAQRWGNGGKLVISNKSDAQMLQKGRGTVVAHDVYEQRAKARISLAFLGEEQTVSIAPDAGSKASAGAHADVASDVVGEWWGVIVPIVQEQLFEVIALVNEGDERYAARLIPDLGEEVDALAVLAQYQAASDLGLELSEEQVREETGMRAPGPGETPLKKAPAPVPPQLAPPPPMEQPAGLRLV